MPFSIGGRLGSFRHAARGIRFLFKTQHNARIHLTATLVVVLLGWWLHVSASDWRWLVVALVLVWAAEAMNTALEHLCNVVSPDLSVSVRMAKDIVAGAVPICA